MIEILPYQLKPATYQVWRPIYLEVANYLITNLRYSSFDFIHFGSTAAKVGGKGIIDLSLLYLPGERESAVAYLMQLGFQHQHSDNPFPPERPRKDGAIIYQGEHYNIHVHVIEKNSQEHHNQINYRDYLLNHPEARIAYEQKKQQLLAQGITEQDAYTKQKAPFVKTILKDL